MKFRCSNCRLYFKGEPHLGGPLLKVCSEACVREYYAKQNSKKRQPIGYQKSLKRKPIGYGKRKPDVPEKVRKRCYARDKYRCRFCGTNENLHLHHIIYRSHGGPHEDWNLITLCLRCHDTVHSDVKRYRPLLRGVLWVQYTGGKYTLVPRFEDWFKRNAS